MSKYNPPRVLQPYDESEIPRYRTHLHEPPFQDHRNSVVENWALPVLWEIMMLWQPGEIIGIEDMKQHIKCIQSKRTATKHFILRSVLHWVTHGKGSFGLTEVQRLPMRWRVEELSWARSQAQLIQQANEEDSQADINYLTLDNLGLETE